MSVCFLTRAHKKENIYRYHSIFIQSIIRLDKLRFIQSNNWEIVKLHKTFVQDNACVLLLLEALIYSE